jgi:guanine deaminase
MSRLLVFRHARVAYSASRDTLALQEGRTLIVDKESGKITINMADSSFESERFENSEIIELTNTQLIIPGLIDTHVHAPQFAFVGTGLDLPLLQWLEKYTFPCEAKFKDLLFAEKVYRKSTAAHIRNGTTTICYYGTLHLEATKLLADIVE